MTNRVVSATPDYSSYYVDGVRHVRLDRTNPQTGAVDTLIIIPDQLTPDAQLHYVSFMSKKAEKDLEEIRRNRTEVIDLQTKTQQELREVADERRATLNERREILEERNEIKGEFLEVLKEYQKTSNTFNAFLAGAPPQTEVPQKSIFAPVGDMCSSAVEGIKSFFFRSGTK